MEGQVTSCRRLDPHTMALGVGLFPFRSALLGCWLLRCPPVSTTALNHKIAHTRDSHRQVTSHNNEREISFGTRGKTLALGPLRRARTCVKCALRNRAFRATWHIPFARLRSVPAAARRPRSAFAEKVRGGRARWVLCWRWEIILAKLQADSSLRCTKLYRAGAVLVFLSVKKLLALRDTFCAPSVRAGVPKHFGQQQQHNSSLRNTAWRVRSTRPCDIRAWAQLQ